MEREGAENRNCYKENSVEDRKVQECAKLMAKMGDVMQYVVGLLRGSEGNCLDGQVDRFAEENGGT